MHLILIFIILLTVGGVHEGVNAWCYVSWHDTKLGYCYRYYWWTVAKNWTYAHWACEILGGQVLSFKNQTFMNNMSDILKHDAATVTDLRNETFWIGLNSLNGRGWEWSDGTPPGSVTIPWQPGFPTSTVSQCGMLSFNPSYGIQNLNCADQHGYICLRDYDYLEDCPWDWNYRSGNCWRMFYTKVTWDEANLTCINQGGHLAVMQNSKDNQIVHDYAGEARTDVWIGYRSDEFGSFEWGNDQCTTYIDWDDKEPKYQPQKNMSCVKQMHWLQETGTWRVSPCSELHMFVCRLYSVNITAPCLTTPEPTTSYTTITEYPTTYRDSTTYIDSTTDSTTYIDSTTDSTTYRDSTTYIDSTTDSMTSTDSTNAYRDISTTQGQETYSGTQKQVESSTFTQPSTSRTVKYSTKTAADTSSNKDTSTIQGQMSSSFSPQLQSSSPASIPASGNPSLVAAAVGIGVAVLVVVIVIIGTIIIFWKKRPSESIFRSKVAPDPASKNYVFSTGMTSVST